MTIARALAALTLAGGLTVCGAPALAASTQAPLKDVHWSFEGPFGHYNQEQLQRGYKVYKRGLLQLPLDELRRLPQPGRSGRSVLGSEIPEPER